MWLYRVLHLAPDHLSCKVLTLPHISPHHPVWVQCRRWNGPYHPSCKFLIPPHIYPLSSCVGEKGAYGIYGRISKEGRSGAGVFELSYNTAVQPVFIPSVNFVPQLYLKTKRCILNNAHNTLHPSLLFVQYTLNTAQCTLCQPCQHFPNPPPLILQRNFISVYSRKLSSWVIKFCTKKTKYLFFLMSIWV